MRRWIEAAVYSAASSLSFLLATAVFRFRLYGWHRVPPGGGVVLASNHQSVLDPPLIGGACPRRIRFLARKTLFRGAFGRLIRALGAIPMDRESPDPGSLREAIGVLRGGGVLLVFPEGTRTPNGSLGPLRAGVSLLARRGEAVVVPCIVRGAFEAWPKGSPLPVPFRPIRVWYGDPLAAREDDGPRGLSERVERAMRGLWAASEKGGGSSR